MQIVIMLSVTYKPFILIVISLSVVMLNVVAPFLSHSDFERRFRLEKNIIHFAQNLQK